MAKKPANNQPMQHSNVEAMQVQMQLAQQIQSLLAKVAALHRQVQIQAQHIQAQRQRIEALEEEIAFEHEDDDSTPPVFLSCVHTPQRVFQTVRRNGNALFN